jgi:hypothetical protein
MRKFVVVVAIAAATLSATAAAPTHRTPGLWEVTTGMHFTQGGIQIPPAVRQQMEAHGIKVPNLTAPRTFKQCLTPEEAARDAHPDFSGDKSCRTTKWNRSGEHFHAEFTCDSDGQTIHGKVDGSMASDGKTYTGTVRMEGNNPAMGGQFVMEGESSGKWLGPSCGKTAP